MASQPQGWGWAAVRGWGWAPQGWGWVPRGWGTAGAGWGWVPRDWGMAAQGWGLRRLHRAGGSAYTRTGWGAAAAALPCKRTGCTASQASMARGTPAIGIQAATSFCPLT